MKWTVLTAGLLCFACLVTGQTNPTVPARKMVTGTYFLKTRQGSENGSAVVWGMNLKVVDDSLITCSGDCELKIGTMLLKADEVDFHPNTGAAEARQNVRIQILPHRGTPTP